MKTFGSFLDEMMVANAAGTGGGFGANSDAKGPTAGYAVSYTHLTLPTTCSV